MEHKCSEIYKEMDCWCPKCSHPNLPRKVFNEIVALTSCWGNLGNPIIKRPKKEKWHQIIRGDKHYVV